MEREIKIQVRHDSGKTTGRILGQDKKARDLSTDAGRLALLSDIKEAILEARLGWLKEEAYYKVREAIEKGDKAGAKGIIDKL